MKINDYCIDSADWIEEISGYRPTEDCISLEQLEFMGEEHKEIIEARMMYFDYPLSEISYLFENEELFDEMQLVRFDDGFGGYEYRMCEI